MSVTFAFFPAGLVLYWVTNTVPVDRAAVEHQPAIEREGRDRKMTAAAQIALIHRAGERRRLGRAVLAAYA